MNVQRGPFARILSLLLISLLPATVMGQSLNCSQYNQPFGPFNYSNGNSNQHNSGSHVWYAAFTGQCSYADPPSGKECLVGSQSNVTSSWFDNGVIALIDCCYHVAGLPTVNGKAVSNGPAVSSGAEAAISVDDCPTSGCGVKAGISAGADGLGASVSFDPSSIWNDKQPYSTSCGVRPPAGGGGGGGGGAGGHCCPPTACSPIIIDTQGKGFIFSDPHVACVNFDLMDTGKPVCLSWPVAGSGNAWLVLPNAKGEVKNSRQLFGNFTPQPHHPSESPNGFLALAEYDDNYDLVIDKNDKVWPRLRLWIDEHCYKNPGETCVSRPSELHSLERFEIESIGLVYGREDRTDKWGNDFKLYSRMNIDKSKEGRQQSKDRLNRIAYDVFLMSLGGKGQACE